MSQNVLTEHGEVIPTQTLKSLTESELASPTEIEKRQRMDAGIRKRYGDSKSIPDNWIKRRKKPGDPELPNPNNESPCEEVYEDDKGKAHEIAEADEFPDLDEYLNAEVVLPKDGEYMQAARVIGRATNSDGNPVGTYDKNPILNTQVYDVMLPDGTIQQYATNIIAENLYSQVDEDGFRYILLDEIIDYKKSDEAIDKKDAFIENKSGRKSRRITTKGWSFLVNWKDGTQSWIPLKDIKESYPIEVAEFAKSRGIEGEPAFAWWVPFTLKKRDKIVSAVVAKVKRSHISMELKFQDQFLMPMS